MDPTLLSLLETIPQKPPRSKLEKPEPEVPAAGRNANGWLSRDGAASCAITRANLRLLGLLILSR